MNLIERYAHEVGKNLPAKQRPDIEAEIRSMIEDMLEEKSQQANRPVDDEMINAALQELGDPEKLAASYLPARYLIGPKLYPTFILVLKIVFAVLAGLAVVGLGFRIGTSDLAPRVIFETILRSLGELFQGALFAFGNIVVIFAILERTLPSTALEEGKEEWSPAELKKEPDPDQVSTWETVMTIVFTLAGLVVLNFYPQLIGIHYPQDGDWVSIPVLSRAFFRVLPLINIAGLLTVLLHGLLLRRERWQAWMRLLALGLDLLGVAIAVILLAGPSIIAITAESLAAISIPADTATLLVRMLEPIAKVALVIAVIAGGVEAIKKLYRIVVKPGEASRLPL